tara:strand:- start:9757 stop:10857 length:1101 start_codon:yes stop_codon:yes gene_type:complete
MKSLKAINNCMLKYLIIIISIILKSQLSYGSEIKILFKINNKAFTSLDYDMRVNYLNFVGDNSNLDRKIILNDFISANLFYEYYNNIENKENYDEIIYKIFEDIKKISKTKNLETDEENLILNIKIDYIRKSILEKILNSNNNSFNVSKEEFDLLYNLKIQYINFENIDSKTIINKINNIEKINIKDIRLILNENNIDYFIKEKEVYNIENLDNRIKNKIISNQYYFIINDNNKVSIILIQKKFETFDGLIANLYSVKSKNELNKEYLDCKNLINIKNDNNKVVNKEYNFVELNDEIKKNLLDINDYIKFFNNDEYIYVVLCNIKFDKEKLNNISINKLINSNVSEIEEKFINKYSRIYNLIKINE